MELYFDIYNLIRRYISLFYINKKITSLLHKLKPNTYLGFFIIHIEKVDILNDALGYYEVNRLLKQISFRIKEYIPSSHFIGQLNGVKFVIITSDISNKIYISEIINHIKLAFSFPFHFKTFEIYINSTIGVSVTNNNKLSSLDLMSQAKQALSRAKSQKISSMTFFQDNPIIKNFISSKRTVRIETELYKAIENNNFEIYYQPIIKSRTDKIYGFEAFLRWHHNKQIVLADNFLPLIENTLLLNRIGNKIIEDALVAIKELQKFSSILLKMSINISKNQFYSENFADTILGLLKKYQVSPLQVELEIREDILMFDFANVQKILNTLTEAGIGIILDDFGTGASSISALSNFPIKGIKIHKDFISKIGDMFRQEAIIKSIIAIGNYLKLDVVAKGVETEEHIKYLKKHNCAFLQGYFYSSPMPLEKAKIFLQNGIIRQVVE